MTDTTLAIPTSRQTGLSVIGVMGSTLRTFAGAPLVFLGFALFHELPSIIVLLAMPHMRPGRFNIVGLFVFVAKMLLLFLFQTAMTYIAVRHLRGERAGLRDAMMLALRRYGPILGASVLSILATYLGMLLLIVPGLILACMYAVAIPVCAFETLGPIESLKRSAILTKTIRWRIAGVFAIVFCVFLLIIIPVTFLVTLRGHVLPGQGIGVGVGLVWMPIATIVPAVLYVELRRVRDNVGLARIFD